MLIQLNTDNHVDGQNEAMREVETDLLRSLATLRPRKGIDPDERTAVDQEIPR